MPNDSKYPVLEPPGSGLPLFSKWMANIGLKTYMVRSDPQKALQHFQHLGESFRKLIMPLSDYEGQTHVLVQPILGIEDSSRLWSPYMVLHHLVIVEKGVVEIVESLVNNKEFESEVRIAAVKPSAGTGCEVLPLFLEVERQYSDFIVQTPSLKTAKQHLRPWFGKLDAYGWHFLMALNRSVHRKQLKAILEKLPETLRSKAGE